MYYRVAIQNSMSPTWKWKSTTISSITSLLQFLRRFHDLPQDHLLVFSSHSREEMEEQLVRENNGLGSDSVTAAQFLQKRMLGSQVVTSTTPLTRSVLKESSGTNTLDKSAVGSQENRRAGGEHRVNRIGFWNIMPLVGS